MKVKMILPRKTASDSPFWRPIKYSLFPPLGLARSPATSTPDDDVEICDEHVEEVTLRRRARPRGDRGLHHLGGARLRHRRPLPRPRRARVPRRAAPDDAALRGRAVRRHRVPADPAKTPGRASWPTSAPAGRGASTGRTSAPSRACRAPRRDLVKRQLYLVPNSLVVSRGCPHLCDFCYKESFFAGGRSFYLQPLDDALAQIERTARPPPLLPRRQPLRQPAVRRGALRRHARHGARVAGGGHRAGGAAAGPARAGRGGRLPQPVHRLRDAERRRPARPAQAAEPRSHRRGRRLASALRSRDPPPARAGRHGQRELRLRHGRRRPRRSSRAPSTGRCGRASTRPRSTF